MTVIFICSICTIFPLILFFDDQSTPVKLTVVNAVHPLTRPLLLNPISMNFVQKSNPVPNSGRKIYQHQTLKTKTNPSNNYLHCVDPFSHEGDTNCCVKALITPLSLCTSQRFTHWWTQRTRRYSMHP